MARTTISSSQLGQPELAHPEVTSGSSTSTSDGSTSDSSNSPGSQKKFKLRLWCGGLSPEQISVWVQANKDFQEAKVIHKAMVLYEDLKKMKQDPRFPLAAQLLDSFLEVLGTTAHDNSE